MAAHRAHEDAVACLYLNVQMAHAGGLCPLPAFACLPASLPCCRTAPCTHLHALWPRWAPAVPAQALKLVTHIGRKGSPDLRRLMARHSGAVRDLLHFRCDPDPFKVRAHADGKGGPASPIAGQECFDKHKA